MCCSARRPLVNTPPDQACDVFLVTGFHRSGTSLTAQWLHRGGIDMGKTLIPPNPSNPDGHFEDSRAVRLHESWLGRQGSDWLFHDECVLRPDAALGDGLDAYIAARDAAAQGQPWGIKDPRLVLALPAWTKRLGERFQILFLARHWAECLQSLAIRHARELAWHLAPPGVRQVHLRPWLRPDETANAWLSSATRMLEALHQHSDRAWLATARGVAHTPSLRSALSGCAALAVHDDSAKPEMKPDLLRRKVSLAMLPPIPSPLRKRLDETWEALLKAAHLRADNEEVPLDPSPPSPRGLRQRLQARMASLPSTPAPAQAAPAAAEQALAAIRDALQAKRPALAEARMAEALASGALSGDSAERAIAQAELAHTQGDVAAAAAAWREAAALAAPTAAVGHVVRAARAWLDVDDGIRALEVFEAERTRLPEPPPPETWSTLARALELAHGTAARDAFIVGLPDGVPALLFLRAQLALPDAYADSREGLRRAVRAAHGQRRLDPWLLRCAEALPTAGAFDALCEALLPHWLEVFGEGDLSTRLGLPPAPAWRDVPALAVLADEPADLERLAGVAIANGWRDDGGACARVLASMKPGDATLLDPDALLSNAPDDPGTPAPAGWLLRVDACLGALDRLLEAWPGLHVLHLRRPALEAALSPTPHPSGVLAPRVAPAPLDEPPSPATLLLAWLSTRLATNALARSQPERVETWPLPRLINGEQALRAAWIRRFGNAPVPFARSHRGVHAPDGMFPPELLRAAEAIGESVALRADSTLPSDFVPAAYLALHRDVAASGMDAVQHWVLHGRQEGRRYAPPLDGRRLTPTTLEARLL